MKKNVLIILLSVFVLSCSSGSDDDHLEVTTNVAAILISKDNLYGGGSEGITKQNLVITNQTAWNDLIAQMNSVNNVSYNFTETDINFSEYTIIAVFDEVKGNGGHNLELKITSNSKNIIVNVTDLAPEGNATTVITQPFNITKIQNSDLPILFE